MILLVDNYDSFTWNIYHYITPFYKDVLVVRNDKFDLKKIINSNFIGIVLSPGPGHPKEGGLMIDLIRANKYNIPILGVCLGHQALGYTYGAKISRMKSVMHGRTDRIIIKKKISLFKNLPAEFTATRYHSLEVNKEKLPLNIEITATTKKNSIMGIKIKNKKLFGLQFHPESIATDYGKTIFNNFLNICLGEKKNEL